jgi:hypothetical protein
MTYAKARAAVNEMVGNMPTDRETALRKLQRLIDYAQQLHDTLSDDGPDTIPFERRAA